MVDNKFYLSKYQILHDLGGAALAVTIATAEVLVVWVVMPPTAPAEVVVVVVLLLLPLLLLSPLLW